MQTEVMAQALYWNNNKYLLSTSVIRIIYNKQYKIMQTNRIIIVV